MCIRDRVDPDPDPGADLGEPAHRKYIQKNSDGTYTLSLNVTGGTTEWTDQTAEPVSYTHLDVYKRQQGVS